ncbi:hypothetical protein ABKN59_009346 [Abortiporus biennis]
MVNPGGNSVSAPPSQAPASRRGGGGRKKANPAADDAAYHGVSAGSGGGTKRTAVEKAEGEPRMKRKRVDAGLSASVGVTHANTPNSAFRKAAERPNDPESRVSMVDFTAMPTPALYRYLAQYDLVPMVDPSPLTAHDPPAPSSLLDPKPNRRSATGSPPPNPQSVTPANRPRRESSISSNRRRSSRLLEDDRRPTIAPVYADIAEVHSVMATIAEKHFRNYGVKEVETLASFMTAVRAQARTRP